MTVAQFASSDQQTQNHWQRVYVDGQSHVDQLLALHHRLIGHVLAEVYAVEQAIAEGPDGNG